MKLVLGILLIILIKVSLNPLQDFSVIFVVYKSAVMLGTWIIFTLMLFGQISVPIEVTTLFGIAAILFALPKLMIARGTNDS